MPDAGDEGSPPSGAHAYPLVELFGDWEEAAAAAAACAEVGSSPRSLETRTALSLTAGY